MAITSQTSLEPVTITLQEFIQGFNSSTIFYNQILLN